MNRLLLKTAFRKTMALTPRWVHKVLTEEKIRRLTKHLMKTDDISRCLSDPQSHEMILARYMNRFPKHAARVNEEIAKVLSDNPLYCGRSDEEKKQLAEDMRFCYFAYGFNVEEYVFFDFAGTNKNTVKRKEFVSDLERICFRFSANDFTESILSNKTSMYEHLKDYYKRDAVAIRGSSDYANFQDFIEKHKRFVEKAAVSSRGQGVRLVEYIGGGV